MYLKSNVGIAHSEPSSPGRDKTWTTNTPLAINKRTICPSRRTCVCYCNTLCSFFPTEDVPGDVYPYDIRTCRARTKIIITHYNNIATIVDAPCVLRPRPVMTKIKRITHTHKLTHDNIPEFAGPMSRTAGVGGPCHAPCMCVSVCVCARPRT